MMTLGVIGGGTVGSALARAFMEWAEVRVYDIEPRRGTHTLVEALAGDVVFVCLPTPATADGSCDLSYVEDFFASHKGYTKNFVLRSTVPVGTTQRLREEYDLPGLIFSPEFLTARCAVTDAQIPARNIIGAPRCECSIALQALYEHRFPGVQIFHLTPTEAEAVKLAVNGFFAVKLAFFNEFRMLTDKLMLGWEEILAAVLADGRIAHSHTRVPGRDGFGFGGACLPKDLSSLVCCIEGAGLSAAVTRAAMERNVLDRERGV
jgi:UDPglucose 6-dehydrogenase